MALRSRSGRTSNRRRTRRRRVMYWHVGSKDPTALAANTQTFIDLLPNVTVLDRAGLTVRRIIGKWSAVQASVDTEVHMMFGICLLNQDAAAASALPELEFDNIRWFWQDRYVRHSGTQTPEVLGGPVSFDIRPNRRMTEETELTFMVENTSANAGEYLFWLRTLLEKS